MIYAAGSDIASGKQMALIMDRWTEKFWRIATKQSSGSVANAVELALKELRREMAKEREGRLGIRTTFGIYVWGDTALY